MLRWWLLLGALAGALPATAAEPVSSVAHTDWTDPARVWERFLAQAELSVAYPAYDALDKVGYHAGGVDAARCRQHASELKFAVDTVPVSLVLHRAAMLCAEVTDEEAAAERELTALAALSKLALSQASDAIKPKPIRILHPSDAYALLHTSGLEYRYAYYDDVRVQRYFPLVLVAWDAEAKVERHLTFDFVDATNQINRKDRYSSFPFNRNLLADAFIEGLVKSNDILGLDIQTVQAAMALADPKAKIAKLRPIAERGGIQAARAWLIVCGTSPFPGCGDGFVDAVLPQTERQHALPMTLLAYAYAEGIGIKQDVDSARQLLDAANRRWRQDGATIEYVRTWIAAHEDELPEELRQRLVLAQSHGNLNVRNLLIRQKLHADGKVHLDETELAYLAEPSRNSLGAGYAVLAGYYAHLEQKQSEAIWTKRAAEAGDAQAQSDYGYALLKGDGYAVDRTAAEHMLAAAAHGGHIWSQRYLAILSMKKSRWTDAEGWLMSAVGEGDIKAILYLAEMYEWERPGVSGKVDRAIEIYRSLADADNVAEARRRLAAMAIAGRGMKKDHEQARKWLLTDAEKADHESEAILGMAYLRGDFGKTDEAEGIRWMERAIEGKEERGLVDYGAWLYYTKKTPESRVRAIELWRAGDKSGYTNASNNLAWALCTSPDASIFDAKTGLSVAGRIGNVAELDPASLDTVAACHAAAGDYAHAVEVQSRAIAQLSKNEDVPATAQSGENYDQGYRDRLDLYRKRQRYLETVR